MMASNNVNTFWGGTSLLIEQNLNVLLHSIQAQASLIHLKDYVYSLLDVLLSGIKTFLFQFILSCLAFRREIVRTFLVPVFLFQVVLSTNPKNVLTPRYQCLFNQLVDFVIKVISSQVFFKQLAEVFTPSYCTVANRSRCGKFGRLFTAQMSDE